MFNSSIYIDIEMRECNVTDKNLFLWFECNSIHSEQKNLIDTDIIRVDLNDIFTFTPTNDIQQLKLLKEAIDNLQNIFELMFKDLKIENNLNILTKYRLEILEAVDMLRNINNGSNYNIKFIIQNYLNRKMIIPKHNTVVMSIWTFIYFHKVIARCFHNAYLLSNYDLLHNNVIENLLSEIYFQCPNSTYFLNVLREKYRNNNIVEFVLKSVLPDISIKMLPTYELIFNINFIFNIIENGIEERKRYGLQIC